jgi:Fe-S-cluster-containing dehydrogenase component
VARETRPRPPEALGLLYDSTLCVGCKACVAACKTANNNPAEFSTLDHLWDTPLDTSGYTFNLIKMYRNGTMDAKDQEVNGFAFMKTSCMHCGDPSCVSACPVSAMTKDPETGVVGYNPDKCIGCRYCVAACPFGIPKYQYDSPTGRIGKCELCRHRHKDGHYSACAEVCPTGATLFGRTEDLLAEAKRRLAHKPGQPMKVPRGHLRHAQEKMLQGKPDGKGAMNRHGWRDEPDQTYEAGRQLPAARLWREGIRRHPGAQAVGGEFPEARHARPAARCRRCDVGNHPAHALRRAADALRRARCDDLRRQAQRQTGG